MNLGDAFLMTVPPKYNLEHLYFVISDPLAHGGAFVAVNVTTDRLRAGKECPVQSGEHRWINRECFVNFADALEITSSAAAHLESLMGKLVRMERPMTAALLARIVAAARASRSFPGNLKTYLERA